MPGAHSITFSLCDLNRKNNLDYNMKVRGQRAGLTVKSIAVLVEDLGLVPATYTAAHDICNCSVRGSDDPFLGSTGTIHIGVHICTCRRSTHIHKRKKETFKNIHISL